MGARRWRESSPASQRLAGGPRRRRQETAEQIEFEEALLSDANGHTVYYPLWRVGIGTFKQTAGMSEAELLRVQNIGPKRVAILGAILEQHGYHLRDEGETGK